MECQVCGDACNGDRVCRNCKAVCYCSEAHQKIHWKQGHKLECQRMAGQMQREMELGAFPFTFAEEVTSQVSKGQNNLCTFLKSQNVHRQGLWRNQCPCYSATDGHSHTGGWALPASLSPCLVPSNPPSRPLLSWEDFCDWRRLSLLSPAPLALHTSLSLYHAINLVKKGRGEREVKREERDEEKEERGGPKKTKNSIVRTCYRIHLLGPETELNDIETLGELLSLFPSCSFDITFIGPEVPMSRVGDVFVLFGPPTCSDNECSCKARERNVLYFGSDISPFANNVDETKDPRVKLTFLNGLYHEVYATNFSKAPPDLVIALNSGLAAYSTWKETVAMIVSLELPAVFTDYCEEAAVLGAHCVESIAGPLPLKVEINPFRRPLSIRNSTTLLPTYSNAFMFGIV